MIASNTSGLAIGGLAQAFADSRPAFSGCISSRPPNACRWSRSCGATRPRRRPSGARSHSFEEIGKRPVLVRDGPGFFATRVFAAYLDEALAMVSEGVAPQRIEDAATANGRALGPLAMLDETGIAAQPAAGPAGPRRRARSRASAGRSPSLCCRAMAEFGRGGRRDGGGFFDWPAEGPRTAVAGPGRRLSPRGATARHVGPEAAAPLRRGA